MKDGDELHSKVSTQLAKISIFTLSRILAASARSRFVVWPRMTTLAQKQRKTLKAIPYPNQDQRSLFFSFESVRLIWGFHLRIEAVEKYNEYGATERDSRVDLLFGRPETRDESIARFRD